MIRTGVQRAIERLAMGQLVAERRHHRVLEIRAGPEIPAACALTLSSQGRSPVEARKLCQHSAEPVVENAEKAALFMIDLGPHGVAPLRVRR